MNFLANGWNIFYVIILAVVSVFTGEIITFVMLGFILMALNSIHGTLKNILENMEKQKNGQ
ncbi:hypothetical protein ACAF76_004325 [Brevibacillus sp. TJ4]|uniref:hypothetical protein n=1 Tax=Brevibacillus sp. TJ4 TaxID=3234853 RepID=UPI0037CF840E